jgi:hypothetical protein
MNKKNALREDLKQQLKDRFASQFSLGRLRGVPNGEAIRWALVAILRPLAAGPVLEVGLTEEGRWVVAAADGSITDVEATQDYLPLFPLLEMSFEDARKALRAQFLQHGLNANWLAFFPFEQIVVAALVSRSAAWAGRALQWLDTLSPSAALRAAVDTLRSTGITQQQRHHAARLLAAWRRLPKD